MDLPPVGLAGVPRPLPRLVPEADVNEVLREQLEFLIESPDNRSAERLARVSKILLEIFEHPVGKQRNLRAKAA
jgi:hypothetical protein